MEAARILIKIHADDSVAVAIRALEAGTVLTAEQTGIPGVSVTALDAIPAGHKIALRAMKAGDKVIKYGYPIGQATIAIEAGRHVHTHNLKTALSETAEYRWNGGSGNTAAAGVPLSGAAGSGSSKTAAPTIQAFERKDGTIGIRNELWIVPTVGCVNRTAEALARWADGEIASGSLAGGSLDGSYAWIHPYGCSQMGEDHATTRTILADLVHHPNAGGVLVLGLGCENNTVEEFKKALGAYDTDRVRFLVTQKVGDEIEEGRKLLSELGEVAKKDKRSTVSASRLIMGMKCGGSDGFSGITANALVGRVTDALAGMGGTPILTEVPEMFGAEQMLMDRCETKALFDRTVELIDGFKQYYVKHNQVVYENPSPGNKEGGISTLEDKSCGCVQKGGKAPVRGVLRYGERIDAAGGVTGLQLLEGPGNDIVSTTALTAAGAHLILFTTGRGTPLGAPAPTVKISSNSALAAAKPGWIDFDAGRLLAADGTEAEKAITDELLKFIFDVASGTKKTKNETNGYREIAIFKDGVTL